MSARSKILVVVGAFTLLVVGTSLAAYAAWTREGVIRVEVDSDDRYGSNVYLEVPAALVPIALAWMPDVCVQNDPDMREARLYAPIVRKAWREIRNGPDGVLVAVDGPNERVRVVKRNGEILVDVRDDGERVRVSCPVRTVDVVTDRFVRVVRLSS